MKQRIVRLTRTCTGRGERIVDDVVFLRRFLKFLACTGLARNFEIHHKLLQQLHAKKNNIIDRLAQNIE